MTWTPEGSRGFESQKIWPLAVPFTNGVGLDIGCGAQKCLPHMIGVDTGGDFGRGDADVLTPAHDLSMFADGSLDFVFSSHLLEHYPKERVPELLQLWASKLKVGGHLVLYLPNAQSYPRVGEHGANPDHKWDIYPDDVWDMLIDPSADAVFNRRLAEARNEGDEYSLFEVYRKIDATNEPVLVGIGEKRNWPDIKTALVIRYGAIGDVLIASSVVQGLHEDGYEVTFFTSPTGEEVLRHDPRIHEIFVHDVQACPGRGAIEFYEAWEKRFDKVVNLDHSLEGPVLGHPKYLSHRWPIEARRLTMGNINYTELAHTIAGSPARHDGPVYVATDEEIEWARKGRDSIKKDGPIVAWAIAGSSLPKVYPWVNVVVDWLLDDNINVVLMGGGDAAAALELGLLQAIYEKRGEEPGMHQLYPRTGKWTLRESLAFVSHAADVVVGPETGLLNAVSHRKDVAKVIYLSHSSHQNLTRDWPSTAVLLPEAERCPCYPCHMIHFDWDTCVRNEETMAAQCASSIAPKRLYDAIKVMLQPRTDFGRVAHSSFINLHPNDVLANSEEPVSP